ncbi:MAG: F0F1 ATP synthase subunit B [Alphaproteobacteria bacterium]
MELFSVEFLHSQVFWTGTAFFVLLGIMAKFVVPAVDAVLAARAAQIKGDLDAASRERAEAAKLLAGYQDQMAKAQKAAAEMVSQARGEAEALANARIKQVEADLARKADEARKTIEAARTQALRDVEDSVAKLAVDIAEKLVAERMDAKLAGKLTEKALKAGLN